MIELEQDCGALKSVSWRVLFGESPWLKSYLLSGGVWSCGRFVGSVGEKVNPELIRQYVWYQNRKRGE